MAEQATLPLSDPSSSPAPASSSAAPAPAPVAASAPTPAPAASPAPAGARPEGIPDSYWDATANSLKVDPTALAKDLKERDELKAFKATEDSRKLTLPQKPEEYEVKLPADFQPPEGVKFEFLPDDPRMAAAKQFALENGLSKDAFSKLLGIYAAGEVQSQTTIKAAREAQITALGVNGPARIDAVTNWMKANGLNHMPGMLVTADIVQDIEKVMRIASSQGNSSFSQQHRSQPSSEIADFDKLSFRQQRAAQDALTARRAN